MKVNPSALTIAGSLGALPAHDDYSNHGGSHGAGAFRLIAPTNVAEGFQSSLSRVACLPAGFSQPIWNRRRCCHPRLPRIYLFPNKRGSELFVGWLSGVELKPLPISHQALFLTSEALMEIIDIWIERGRGVASRHFFDCQTCKRRMVGP